MIHSSVANPLYFLKSDKNTDSLTPSSNCTYSIDCFNSLDVGNFEVYILMINLNASIPYSILSAWSPNPSIWYGKYIRACGIFLLILNNGKSLW